MNINNLEASETHHSGERIAVATGMNNLRVESADAAREWLSLEHLAHGSERVGGMVVQSVPMRKVLKAISRFSPHKATVLVLGESGNGQRTGRTSPAYAGLGDRPVCCRGNGEPHRDGRERRCVSRGCGPAGDAATRTAQVLQCVQGSRPMNFLQRLRGAQYYAVHALTKTAIDTWESVSDSLRRSRLANGSGYGR